MSRFAMRRFAMRRFAIRRFVMRHCCHRLAPLAAALLLAACASGPPPPDWQATARSALDSASAAYLRGDSRVALQDLDRAREALSRTGRADLLARAELMHCAAQVASLAQAACHGFERLRQDAPAAELAYADYLGGSLGADRVALLPPAQQAAARAPDAETGAAAARQIEDPLSRLVAAAVLLQSGRGSPALITLAVDTASAQGWRRPLLAWLTLQLQRAEAAGDADAASQLRRRLGWITEPSPR